MNIQTFSFEASNTGKRSASKVLGCTLHLLIASVILFTYEATAAVKSRAQTPAPPTALTATAASSSQIDLTWQDNSGNEYGFKVERASSSSGPWTQVDSTGANITSDASIGLNASTTYYFRVCAYNSKGNSSYSNIASATTLAPSSGTICTYTIYPYRASVYTNRGSDNVGFTAGATGSWTATSGSLWITVAASGAGNGTVSYSVAANTSPS